MTYETVLFDLDGTLIDTNELIHQSFVHTFKTFGYTFSDEEIVSFNGPPLIDTFMKVNPSLVDEMMETYQKHNFEYHHDYVKIFPQVKETLDVLAEKQVKLGVVSTKRRNGVLLGLEFTGIKDYFTSIITFDDVENAKPDPEPIEKAMIPLNAKPETTLMVGDSFQDIEAGHRAKVSTAGVAWSIKGEDFLAQYRPTYMLQNMQEILQIVGD